MEAQRVRGYLGRGSGIRRAVASGSWTAGEARSVLAEIDASGLSVVAFCRRNGLCRQRVAYWKRRLAGDRLSTKPVLVPVRVLETRSTSGTEPIEIAVRGERTVRVRVGFDRELLRQVLEVLEC